jgi:hypothetical protein
MGREDDDFVLGGSGGEKGSPSEQAGQKKPAYAGGKKAFIWLAAKEHKERKK